LLTTLILLTAQTSPAQTTITGIVQDELTGEPLAGAAVILNDLDRSTATGSDGRYVFHSVPSGPRRLTVRFVGHAPRTLQALVPADGVLEINVSLLPEPVQLPAVEVRTRAIVRGAEENLAQFPDREASITAVRNHPLLSEPDVLQAMSGGEVVLKPESPSGIHIRGGSSDQTAYLLDGIPVFSPYHTAGLFSAWNPDALSRLHLSSSGRSPALPHALSGTVEGITRLPGDRLHALGSVSTTQARATVDGPLGILGAGYQLSLRSGFPDIIPHEEDPSFLSGNTADELAKVEAPTFGGRARLLVYNSSNSIDTAALAAMEEPSESDPPRNTFDWHSFSWGGEWGRVVSGIDLRMLGWSAEADANSKWGVAAARETMEADRRDVGVLASAQHNSTHTATNAGFRLERIKTSYAVETDSAGVAPWTQNSSTPVATFFAQHSRALSSRFEIEAGLALASFSGDVYASPRAHLRSKSSEKILLSASYARTHQFAQSFRNPESVAGNIFPVDLFMGAGASGIPVARSDQGILAVEYRPGTGMRFGVQGYVKQFDDLLLVAPREGEPFSSGSFVAGTGTTNGMSVDAAMSSARWGLVASYGLQRLRLESGGSDYVPDHGATHQLQGGVIYFPVPSFSVRIGAEGILGRRATPIVGQFEWEANNLLDQGTEFGGSPLSNTDALGAVSLPAYSRVDVGVRKTFDFQAKGREARIALFATVTNVLGRRNILTYARDPATGILSEIEMRPLAPLVFGLDWRF
jgi:hypothetical protein